MPVIPPGNITILELIDLAFEQKYGSATVDPLELDRALEVSHQWEAVRDAVEKAFKAHDIMFYVESLDGTEKRLTYQQSDENLLWRTLLTGKLEHEPDPAVCQRTVYVRDDDASTFLKEFTRKEIEQPDTATDGADEGKAAELPEPTDPAPSAVRPNRRGRKKGVGGYDSKDKPLIKKMHRLINSGKATSPSPAAHMVVDKAVGKADVPNKVKRLVRRYLAHYSPGGNHSL